MEGVQNLVTAVARTHLCCAASITDGRRFFYGREMDTPTNRCNKNLQWYPGSRTEETWNPKTPTWEESESASSKRSGYVGVCALTRVCVCACVCMPVCVKVRS